jgi:uncharacterized membrane protein
MQGLPMALDPYNLMLIALVTAVTLATRLGGALIMARVQLGPSAKAAFEAMPVAVMTAVLAPAALTQGWAEALAAIIAVIVGLRAPMYVVLITGMVCVVLFRVWLP